MKFAKRPTSLASLAVALVFVAGACGGSEGESISGGDGGGGSGSGASGEVVVSGSSTVEPISSLVAEKFQGENPDVSISVDGPGTGDGFELFCKGDTDVSDASRPIEAEEQAACEEAGIEYIELKVAIDGLTVMTNPANSAVECLDYKDLYALLGIESEGFESWSDANDLAAEIDAGNAPYPDVPLEIVGPGQESGTYDSFAELVLEGIAVDERKQPEDGPFIRPDYQSSPNDNVIIQGIEGSETSLGWVGFAFASEAGDQTKSLAIDGGDGSCVEPTPESIADGSYPISRDLFVYVNAANAEQNDALAQFVDFYLSEEGLASVGEVGYVDQPTDQLQSSKDAWEAMETGTREG